MATESALRKKIANWLVTYIGITEGSTQHKQILSIFNNSGLCSRYKVQTSDAWCATAVSAAFIDCGLASIFPCVECSCANMITLAKAAGIWVEDDSYTPKQGDVLLYDWQDSGSGDNTGTPDHVGIVYSISGTTIKVIEGNKSDTVGYRSIQVNGKYIRGYVTPNYASAASGSDTSSSDSATIAAGKQITLNNVNMYNTATTNTVASVKTGTYYLWDAVENNGRIRITNSASNVGVKGQITGWINVSDIGVTSTGSTASTTTTTASTTTSSVPYMVQVTASNLNIRKGAGTNYAKVGVCPPGAYTIVEEAAGEGSKSGFGLLKSYQANRNGWISLDYTTKIN